MPERRVQPARKCKQQRPPLESKSTNGISNQDIPHSVPEPIAAPTLPGDIPSKARIRWPKGNESATWLELDEELTTTLKTRLKGPTAKQLSLFCDLVYQKSLEKFGEEEKKGRNERRSNNQTDVKSVKES